MMPLDNKHTESLEEYTCGPFKEVFVEQVRTARDSVFAEIREDLNITFNQDVRACYMAKKTVTRDKLISWLETVCCILDSFALPLLDCGVGMIEDFQKLKDEKIQDQKTIIKLQDKLIEKREEEISSVQSTVKTELKSYSAVVSQSCKAALAQKKIAAAVKKVTDKEDRSKNVVIYGMQEASGEDISKRVEELLTEIDEKPRIQDCCRIGVVKPDTCRPIKFTLASNDHVRQILTKSKSLRTKEGFKSVYICPDRSVEERKAFKKLVEELKQKRISEPGYVHTIRNNKISSVLRDSEPVNTG